MKIVVRRVVEIEVTSVMIEVPVLFGTEDIPSDFPLRTGDIWRGTIDIKTGRIWEWPVDKQEYHHLNMKVCDGGKYTLLSPDGGVIKVHKDYCPNKLIPGSYGDYIDLDIEKGIVKNWYKNPRFSDFFS